MFNLVRMIESGEFVDNEIQHEFQNEHTYILQSKTPMKHA